MTSTSSKKRGISHQRSSHATLAKRDSKTEVVDDFNGGKKTREAGGGYSTNVYKGSLRPEVQPLPFYIPFVKKKGTPFVYLLLTNGTPFTYLVYNFASLLTAVNALSFK